MAEKAHKFAVVQPDEDFPVDQKPPLSSDGGGGNFSDMEARVKRLEDDSKEIRADLKKLLADTAELKGRAAAAPTTIQLVGFAIAIFVASGMLRWFGH